MTKRDLMISLFWTKKSQTINGIVYAIRKFITGKVLNALIDVKNANENRYEYEIINKPKLVRS